VTRPPILGGWHAIPYGIPWRLRTASGNSLPRNCEKQFRAARKSGRRHARADGRAYRAAHPAGHAVAAAAGEPRHHRAGSGAGDPRGRKSKISRIELGRNAIREIDVLDLLTYYGVGAVEREQLLSLAEQANRPGWWHRYNDILPDWFQSYVGMEEAATSIRIYEPQFHPRPAADP